ncbi:ABC transporter permease [Halohasta salina]|uniref:ABC transporter permease n=1 Tax=Halohasta salina TaxID=2961621 RepID=UPI0020A2F37C|nr:ABC transporter permease subunit [Halohasta salina]
MGTDTTSSSTDGWADGWNGPLGERVAVPVSVLIVMGVWTLAASQTPSYIFPTIPELLASIVGVFGSGGEFSVVDNYGMTLLRVLAATVLCLVVGISAGILMGTSQRADDYLFVYVLGTFAFPSVIWAFLAVIWFGLTTWFVAVFTVFMIVAPYVAISIKEGIEELDSNLTEMADSFDASSYLVWQNIYIPHLYPHIFGSTRLTLTLAWKITLIAEIFGTQLGLGEIINYYFKANQNDMIIAWVLPMMALMFLIDRGLRRIETERFSWRDADAPTQAA